MLQSAGLESEAFDLAAPRDHPVDDKNIYNTTKSGFLDLALVDETPATKRHEMVIGDQSIKFTASSGHLMAYAPKDPDNPNKPADPQAAIFYTSYTRDNLPLDKRPVTFIFNGGPGSASIWLHMGGALGPWRLVTGLPELAAGAEKAAPTDFPLVENRESLLDKSDLVFVDPPGTGHSVAITTYDKSDPANPKIVIAHKNQDFWGVMSDARLMQDFITRYINLHNRQSSPKYLFGESYGAGVRVPILSDLLLNAKGSRYDPDPSGKPANYLAGSVLLSPVLDMSVNCTQNNTRNNCAAWLPTFALIADYHKKGAMRGNLTVTDFIDKAKKYVDDIYLPAFPEAKAKKWGDFLAKNPEFPADMEKYTGLAAPRWKTGPYLSMSDFASNLISQYKLNGYDGRMKVLASVPYNFDYYEHTGFHNAFAKFLPAHIGYTNGSYYTHLNKDGDGLEAPNFIWNWNRGKGESRATTTAVPEIQDGLRVDPSWKIMVAHGLYDQVTPFFPTELDLRKVKLTERIPLKTYEGGHMLYYQESSRIEFKKDLVEFYKAAPYSGPAIHKTPAVAVN